MARKVFMSVLGSTFYNECTYVDLSKNFKSESTRYIQTAMLEKIAKLWTVDDVAYIFLTKGENGSAILNWEDNGHTNNKTNEKILSKGLKNSLAEMSLNINVNPVYIENGNNEKEILDNFRIIFDCLQINDEVYFDVTHGFRSLPMLVMVLNNYSKFLKGIKVQSISYGNYADRNKNNEASIINLSLLSKLQDLTSAANMFFETGRTSEITKLIDSNGFTALDEFFREISECRGMSIYSGMTAEKVKKELQNKIDQNHVSSELLNKINSKVLQFKLNDILNGFRAVEFCIQYKLTQQGITLLQEFIISYLLEQINYPNWQDEIARNAVSGCLSIEKIDCYKTPSNYSDDENKKQIISKIVTNIFSLPFKKELTDKVYKKLSLGSRNDLNHAGIRPKPKNTGYFEDRLITYFELTKEILSLKL